MNLQEMIDNKLTAERSERLKTSEQLMLGELIIKVANIKNKDLPVYFDEANIVPTGIDSWRGVYAELAIEYRNLGKDEKAMIVEEFERMLSDANGKTFQGYKGGDFLMGKNTPLWVANNGECTGFKENDKYDNQAIVDISELEDAVIIETKLITD